MPKKGFKRPVNAVPPKIKRRKIRPLELGEVYVLYKTGKKGRNTAPRVFEIMTIDENLPYKGFIPPKGQSQRILRSAGDVFAQTLKPGQKIVLCVERGTVKKIRHVIYTWCHPSDVQVRKHAKRTPPLPGRVSREAPKNLVVAWNDFNKNDD